MPLYEFHCQNCGHTQEVLMKFSDPNPSLCPRCKLDQLRKVMSRTSFVLKGQGWYETDFKKKSAPSSEGETAAPVTTPAKDDAPAAVSAPAATNDSKLASEPVPVKPETTTEASTSAKST